MPAQPALKLRVAPPARDGDRSYLDTVLVVSPDPGRRAELEDLVDRGGWLAIAAGSAQEAAWELSPVLPHLVVIDVPTPEESDWALELIDQIRSRGGGDGVPVVVVTPRESRDLAVAAFERKADDVVSGRPHVDELIARLGVRLERRPVPRDALVRDPVTGALTPASFADQIEHELERVARGGQPGVLALLQFDELPELEVRHGLRARDEILAQVVTLIREDSRDIDFVGHARGVLAILMPATPGKGGQVRLERLSRLLSSRSLMVAGAIVRLTPIIGYAGSAPGLSLEALEERAWVAVMHQAEQLDLHPTAWSPALSGESTRGSRLVRALGRARTPLQLAVQQLACLVVPFAVYVALDRAGLDVTGIVYFVLVIGLACTAAAIWAEGFAALRRPELPEEPDVLPPATADDCRLSPQRGCDRGRDGRGVSRPGLPGLPGHPCVQHAAPAPGRGGAAGDRRPRPAAASCCGSRVSTPRRRTSMPPSPASDGEFVGVFDADHHPTRQRSGARGGGSRRLRRRPGALRRSQRRRVVGRPHRRGRSSRRSTR